jgi:hypothetical protein
MVFQRDHTGRTKVDDDFRIHQKRIIGLIWIIKFKYTQGFRKLEKIGTFLS